MREEVGSVSGLFSRPWVLSGDLNIVRMLDIPRKRVTATEAPEPY